MDFLEQYVLDYSENFPFRYVESVSLKVLDVSIGLDIFEYEDKYNHREKAHVVLKKGNLTYECDFCDQHDYENDFYPIILHGDRSWVHPAHRWSARWTLSTAPWPA